MACRSLIFRTSLYANILPPGVSNNSKSTGNNHDTPPIQTKEHAVSAGNNKNGNKNTDGLDEASIAHHNRILQKHAIQDGINIDDIINFDEPIAKHSHEKEFPGYSESWSQCGRHPLFKLLKRRHHREGGKLVIPEKKSSLKSGDMMYKKKLIKDFLPPNSNGNLSAFDSEEVSQHIARFGLLPTTTTLIHKRKEIKREREEHRKYTQLISTYVRLLIEKEHEQV